MNLGNAISKYWIYKWVHVSSLQTCSISSDFTQTVPSKEQASPVRGWKAAVFPGFVTGGRCHIVYFQSKSKANVLNLSHSHHLGESH